MTLTSTPTTDTSEATDPAAVDKSTWTGVTHPPHTPVKHPRLPDSANDERFSV